MINKAITTFGYGNQSELLEVSLPTLAKYAHKHNYDLIVPSEHNFAEFKYRAYSWWKIPLLLNMLQAYEQVLWIDADVVIVNDDKDIMDDLGDYPMGMVVHNTPDGLVPNCGVWPVHKSARDFLQSTWNIDSFKRSQCWWEQAAIISQLGGDPDATPVVVPENNLWKSLPYEWNPHMRDYRGHNNCRFFHATCYPNRKQAMINALKLNSER